MEVPVRCPIAVAAVALPRLFGRCLLYRWLAKGIAQLSLEVFVSPQYHTDEQSSYIVKWLYSSNSYLRMVAGSFQSATVWSSVVFVTYSTSVAMSFKW